MAFKKEYSWSDVKQLIADSEARPSPFTYSLARFRYEDQKAVYDADQLAYQPLKDAYDEQRKQAIDQRRKDVDAFKEANPGVKPKFGPLVLPAAPAAPVAPQLPDAQDFHGHAGALHQRYTDEQLVQRGEQIGVASAFTRVVGVSYSKDHALSVKTRDQSILIRSILNSKLGQAALGALDAAASPARLTITQVESLNVNMRVAKSGGGGAPTTPGIKQIKLILDSGAGSLHVVTCYPEDAAAGGSRYMADSSYSISAIEHRIATAGVTVRWSTQTDKAIP